MKLKRLLYVIGVVQIVLGVLYLCLPQWLLAAMGHSAAPPDLQYPLAMLAARFLVYGGGLLVAARHPEGHVFWIRNMALIQLVDLAAGMFYTATGVVPVGLSAFPMINATLFMFLILVWLPRPTRQTAQA